MICPNSIKFPTQFQLIVLDTKTGKQFHIPSLKSSKNSIPAECPCGIHSIALNPSQTLFATGAENTNDLAVYQLPTFDPAMVGEVSDESQRQRTCHKSALK